MFQENYFCFYWFQPVTVLYQKLLTQSFLLHMHYNFFKCRKNSNKLSSTPVYHLEYWKFSSMYFIFFFIKDIFLHIQQHKVQKLLCWILDKHQCKNPSLLQDNFGYQEILLPRLHCWDIFHCTHLCTNQKRWDRPDIRTCKCPDPRPDMTRCLSPQEVLQECLRIHLKTVEIKEFFLPLWFYVKSIYLLSNQCIHQFRRLHWHLPDLRTHSHCHQRQLQSYHDYHHFHCHSYHLHSPFRNFHLHNPHHSTPHQCTHQSTLQNTLQ